MDPFTRYAVDCAPPAGDVADRAAEWLGWDAARGLAVAQPDLGLPAAEITRDPRKYGFHGTIRAPFRLGEGVDFAVLDQALTALAARLAPVRLDGLRLESLGGFLALVPEGDESPLLELAAEVVSALDPLRAPLTATEIAKRRPERLSFRQRQLLEIWGYPYVMEEFRFHLTLTDRLADPDPVAAVLRDHFAPVLPRPFPIGDLCLFGEGQDGQFRILHRYTLSG